MPIPLPLLLCLALPSVVPPQRPVAGAQSPATADRSSETSDPSYYFLLARFYEGEGRIDDAVDALKQAMTMAPKSAELRAELAALYARQDRAREAVEAAEQALAIDPKNREANRILGTVLAASVDQKKILRPGDDPASYPDKAIAALEIARGDGGGELSLDLALARLYIDRDRPGDAVPLLRRIVDEQPSYAEGWLLLADAQAAAGNGDDAAATLKDVLENEPDSFRARARLAEVFDRQRKFHEAAEAWGQAQKLNPRNPELMARRGFSLLNARELDAAEGAARELRSTSPDDVRGIYLQAQVLLARERYQDALDLLKPEIERLRGAGPSKASQTALLLGVQGSALLQLNRNDEAVAALKDASSRAPENTTVKYQLGAALDRSGRQAEAERMFRDLLTKDPLDANTLNYLGYMLAERGTKLDEAVSLIQRALKVEPDNPSYLDSLGWAYVQQGKLDLADPPLTKAAAGLPNNSVIQDHLGDLRLKQNRRNDAIAAWQAALAGDGDSIDRAKIQKKIDAARKASK
jgi:tetratricopeptide (TPR) repeat protein